MISVTLQRSFWQAVPMATRMTWKRLCHVWRMTVVWHNCTPVASNGKAGKCLVVDGIVM